LLFCALHACTDLQNIKFNFILLIVRLYRRTDKTLKLTYPLAGICPCQNKKNFFFTDVQTYKVFSKSSFLFVRLYRRTKFFLNLAFCLYVCTDVHLVKLK